MNETQANRIADRIFATWPSCKVAHSEWVRQLTPTNGLDPYTDLIRMGDAIRRLAGKPMPEFRTAASWPSFSDLLAEYTSLAPRPEWTGRPTNTDVPPAAPLHEIAPGVYEPPIAAPDEPDRFKLDPDLCATGLIHLRQLRGQMIAQAAAARPNGRARYGSRRNDTPPALEQEIA